MHYFYGDRLLISSWYVATSYIKLVFFYLKDTRRDRCYALGKTHIKLKSNDQLSISQHTV